MAKKKKKRSKIDRLKAWIKSERKHCYQMASAYDRLQNESGQRWWAGRCDAYSQVLEQLADK